MGKKAGFDVECTKDGSVIDQSLERWDAFVFYTCGDLTKPDKYNNPPMTAAGKQRFLDAVAAGKGYVGFHSAADTFHSPGVRDATQKELDEGTKLVMAADEFFEIMAKLGLIAPDDFAVQFPVFLADVGD